MSAKFGTPKCLVCQKPVYPADSATVNGKQVHKSSCLKCATCSKTLSVDMTNEHEGKIYCQRDFKVAKGEMAAPKTFAPVDTSKVIAEPRQMAPPPATKRERPPSTSLQGNTVRQRAAVPPPMLPGMSGATMPLSQAVFKKYAQDRPGLTPQEFQVMCMEMGYLLTDQELDIAIKLLDSDHSGIIEYNEFLRFWKTDERFAKLQLSEEKLVEMNEMFRLFISFDKDGSGTIEPNEWTQMHQDLTTKGYSTIPAQQEWQNIDVDGSGFVSFNEFVAWIVAKKAEQATPRQKVILPTK